MRNAFFAVILYLVIYLIQGGKWSLRLEGPSMNVTAKQKSRWLERANTSDLNESVRYLVWVNIQNQIRKVGKELVFQRQHCSRLCSARFHSSQPVINIYYGFLQIAITLLGTVQEQPTPPVSISFPLALPNICNNLSPCTYTSFDIIWIAQGIADDRAREKPGLRDI